MRTGSALGGGIAALAALCIGVAPAATAAPTDEIRPPLDYGWDGLACGANAGFIGSGYFGLPHVIPAVTGDPVVECTSERNSVARSATAAAVVDARAPGIATEGTISTAFAGVGASHRISKPVKEVRYEVVVDVQESSATIEPQFQGTTSALTAVQARVWIPGCERCGDEELVFLADSDPLSDLPESAAPGPRTLEVFLRADGRNDLRGTADVAVTAFGFVITGTHAGPAAPAAGIAGTKVRVERISIYR